MNNHQPPVNVDHRWSFFAGYGWKNCHTFHRGNSSTCQKNSPRCHVFAMSIPIWTNTCDETPQRIPNTYTYGCRYRCKYRYKWNLTKPDAPNKSAYWGKQRRHAHLYGGKTWAKNSKKSPTSRVLKLWNVSAATQNGKCENSSPLANIQGTKVCCQGPCICPKQGNVEIHHWPVHEGHELRKPMPSLIIVPPLDLVWTFHEITTYFWVEDEDLLCPKIARNNRNPLDPLAFFPIWLLAKTLHAVGFCQQNEFFATGCVWWPHEKWIMFAFLTWKRKTCIRMVPAPTSSQERSKSCRNRTGTHLPEQISLVCHQSGQAQFPFSWYSIHMRIDG